MIKKRLTVAQVEDELRSLYEQRRSANPKYSVRRMAIKFGILDSTLQKVIRGDRKLGIKLALQIGEKLNFDVAPESAPVPSRSRKNADVKMLNGEAESQVSWLNLAILEMLKLKDFKPNASWIAKKLGVPVEVVKDAVERMKEDKILDCSDERNWVDCLGNSSSIFGDQIITTDHIRRMQTEMLRISGDKISSVPYSQREHGFSVIPVSSKSVGALKKKLKKLQWEFCEQTEKSKHPKDQIYSFHIGFFPLTTPPQENT